MIGLPMLDVAVGLVFILLLLSLVVTAANELLASWMKRRSLTLWRGVVQLLGGEEAAAALYAHPLIAGMSDERLPRIRRWRQRAPWKRYPSYIPSRTFALALLHTLGPPGAITLKDRMEHEHLAKSLTALLADAEDDLEEFKKNIERWFNNAMERVSGWYKRRTQWLLVVLAVVVTVARNAAPVSIAPSLGR